MKSSTAVKWLYSQGLTETEICERLGTSRIWTLHTIADAVARDAQLRGKHLRARRMKGRIVRAKLVNDEPYWEPVR
ncbi:MAG: hypothetical protein PHH32_03200 [Eubacteriales bacterium]|nr:hypothetical protein [Eubacteriales bacterium]